MQPTTQQRPVLTIPVAAILLLSTMAATAGAAAPQCPAPTDGKPQANRLKWATASEQDSFGFDVWRSDSEKGELTRLTGNPLLAAGTTDETHQYEYRDETIELQREYWYTVELIHTDGSRERIISAWKAPAKCPAAS